MGAVAERLDTDRFEEVDGRRNRQECCRIASAGPVELVLPTRRQPAQAFAPAENRRAKLLLPARMNVEETRAKWRAEPFVTARRVEIAFQPIEVDRDGRRRVRPVDADGDFSLPRAATDLRHRQD